MPHDVRDRQDRTRDHVLHPGRRQQRGQHRDDGNQGSDSRVAQDAAVQLEVGPQIDRSENLPLVLDPLEQHQGAPLGARTVRLRQLRKAILPGARGVFREHCAARVVDGRRLDLGTETKQLQVLLRDLRIVELQGRSGRLAEQFSLRFELGNGLALEQPQVVGDHCTKSDGQCHHRGGHNHGEQLRTKR